MNRLLQHFGFSHLPFGRNTPKQALLRHRGFEEALQRLLFSVELDGIAELVAETGCGKSLLLGELATLLQSQSWVTHYFAHSTVGPFSLLNVLARKAGVAPRRSRGETAVALAETLLEATGWSLILSRSKSPQAFRTVPESVCREKVS